MAHYGYGTGNYLTNFEDYYKSSDESEEEGKRSGVQDVIPAIEVDSDSTFYCTESEDEDRQFYQGKLKEKNSRKEAVKKSLAESKIKVKSPRSLRCYAVEPEKDVEKVFSNDYADLCQYECPLCSKHIETDKLSSHLSSNHGGAGGGNLDLRPSQYSRETWHRCGICQKVLLFTRLKLRYHVISEHGLHIKEYNEKFMRRNGRLGGGRDESKTSSLAEPEAATESFLDPSAVSKNQISDDYADLLKTVCKICSKTVEMDKFRPIHLKKHGLDSAAYTAVHGEPSPVKLSYHQCHICQTLILFTRSGLASHISKHEVSVRDYGNMYLNRVRSEKKAVGEIDADCLFSNDYGDECLTVCQMCEKSLKYANLGSHLYQSHKTKMKTYIEKFGEPEFSKKTYHECAICHETLLFMKSHIKTHVKTKHGLTISAYNKAHMQLNKVEYSVNSLLLEKGRKVGTQKVPQWCDGTLYKCPYCFTLYYRYFTFRIHLINSHKMTDTEERSICVRENEILTDIYHCKICSTQVKRDRMDIEAHLKQAHKTTIKIYSSNFENPNVRDAPEVSVEKLVRKGLLTEPTRVLNKVPKQIKIKSSEPRRSKRSENKSKLVSIRKNKDRILSRTISAGREKMKTETIDQSYLTDTNYNQTLSTSHTDSDSDYQVRKKRRKKSPSPIEERSELKISDVSSLAQETHQDVEVKKENETSGSGDEGWVFKCPVYPCDWTCGREGMIKGPAVLHLLKKHNIQPLEMRERGIKFAKIKLY